MSPHTEEATRQLQEVSGCGNAKSEEEAISNVNHIDTLAFDRRLRLDASDSFTAQGRTNCGEPQFLRFPPRKGRRLEGKREVGEQNLRPEEFP